MNDNDKNKILPFGDIKKKMEEINKSNEPDYLFENFGIDIDNEDLKNLLSTLNMEDFIENIQSGKISNLDINTYIENFKKFEKELNNAKKMYRNFTQWRSFHKPYDLSSLYTLEQIRNIAKTLEVNYDERESKNSLIKKIEPYIREYLEKIFLKCDNDIMIFIGKLISNNGQLHVEFSLSEEDELLIDFLQEKCIVSRVSEQKKHIIVIPKEILQSIFDVDFKKISKYNNLNTFIKKATISFANTYGVCPVKLLFERVIIEFKDEEIEDLETYIERMLNYYFASSLDKSMSSFYSPITVNNEYIKHGIIDLTKYLFDIQNENILEYKYLTKADIYNRGSILYFEESIYLKNLINLISEKNTLDKFEIVNIQNIIFLFSYIEFEPNLILQLLTSKYDIDEHYYKILDILKTYYKNGEKWILKGHTPFEANNSKNVDISKIIKINFKNGSETNE